MFTETLQPRFSETDALGHINNTVFATWFESGRQGVFRIFTPDLDVKRWTLIIASIHINYHAQTHYNAPVELRTWISRIGGSSFDIYQEAWQNGQKCASGTAVMVKFDYTQQRASKLTTIEQAALNSHLLPTP
ncbi:acyl-CoA thioesterase [Alishewanella sp. 16-MA]|uniref:Acyl-CoA thioesterase n=1 Tax=Alishewanella maricola TaxID=2795740 RepID=A0ABS8C1X2_9ALTE|nr:MULTISPECIES: thioesterase family protein [Gammaproteobacteria]MDP4944148.1 acyl-CoA thioesterase [Alishewanella sp.]MDP5207344.1 thioesterase family protein [Alishewanella sp. SMS9]MCB5226314.1 acyl-CoA thioesterase [Alishewanella maricola]MCC5450667.1 acyl-CoA thioesterase [Rheinheimera sp. UJ51]MCF4008667.1 acyl-CoA thioesterase [Rheinheimera sp. UJ63]